MRICLPRIDLTLLRNASVSVAGCKKGTGRHWGLEERENRNEGVGVGP